MWQWHKCRLSGGAPGREPDRHPGNPRVVQTRSTAVHPRLPYRIHGSCPLDRSALSRWVDRGERGDPVGYEGWLNCGWMGRHRTGAPSAGGPGIAPVALVSSIGLAGAASQFSDLASSLALALATPVWRSVWVALPWVATAHDQGETPPRCGRGQRRAAGTGDELTGSADHIHKRHQCHCRNCLCRHEPGRADVRIPAAGVPVCGTPRVRVVLRCRPARMQHGVWPRRSSLLRSPCAGWRGGMRSGSAEAPVCSTPRACGILRSCVPGMLHAIAVWESPLLRFPVSGWRALTWILAHAFSVCSMAPNTQESGLVKIQHELRRGGVETRC